MFGFQIAIDHVRVTHIECGISFTRVAGFTLYLFFFVFTTPVSADSPPSAQKRTKTHSLAEAISVDPGITCLEKLILIRSVRKWLERNEIDSRIRVEVEGSRNNADKAMFIVYKGDRFPNRSYFDSTADYCGEFHSALGLSIAMAINATVIEPQPKEGLLEPGYDQSSRFALLLLGSYALLPGVAPGIEAYFESWYSWLGLRAGVMGFFTLEQSVSDDTDGKYDATLIAGYVDLCSRGTLVNALRFAVCAGVAGGQFRTEGIDDVGSAVIRTEARTFPWAAPSVGCDLAVEFLDWLELAVSADVFIALWSRAIRITYVDESPAAQQELPHLGITIGIGPVFHIQ